MPATEVAVDSTWTAGAHTIDGMRSGGPTTIEKLNPARPSVVIGRIPMADEATVAAAVEAARSRSRDWRGIGPIERAGFVFHLAELLHRDQDRLAGLISEEHGKTRTDARSEVTRSVEIARHVAGMGRRLGGRYLPSDTTGTWSLTRRDPIGVVALITPWNFPLAIPLWKLAPAMVAGCTAVLKPSPLAPFTAEALAALVQEAGVPDGVVNLVHGGAETGAALVRHPAVAGVSFTGSVEAGRRVQLDAAASFTRTQLEMGGKNAVIVMPDADLRRAARAIVLGAFGQSGQRCSATSRAIIHTDVYDEVLRLVVDLAERLRVGPPTDPEADLGPLIDRDSLRRCLAAVEDAVTQGGRLLTGGVRIETDEGGFFMAPTVVADLSPDAALANTEVFGPVLAALRCRDLDDAIAVNNRVRYGMSATVFTRGLPGIDQFLNEAQAGMLHVNRPGVGAFAHMPHIGTKDSQAGPAECSDETFDFYTQLRTVTIDTR